MTPEQEKLVLEHRHLIPKIVRKCLRLAGGYTSLHIEDLVSEGYVALIETAQKYDPTKEVSFKALINIIVPYRIIDYLRRIDSLTREHRKKITKDLATCKITVKSKKLAVIEPGWTEQLPTGIGSIKDIDRYEDLTIWEKIDTHTPEVAINYTETLKLIKRLGLKYLGKRNLDILLATYIKEDTQVELSEKYNLNESRISQINTQNLAVMRKKLLQCGYSQTNHLL